MRVYILICLSLLAAPMVAAQVVYRFREASRLRARRTTCPPAWTASTESITTDQPATSFGFRQASAVAASVSRRVFVNLRCGRRRLTRRRRSRRGC